MKEEGIMRDKICLVTGANIGIGKATALGLAKLEARVIMVSRDKEKGQRALKEIIIKSKNKNVDLFTADFASFMSVRDLADKLKSKYERIDVLINNAGTFLSKLRYSKDNIEMQFAVNHLSPFLLTNLLLDTIKKSSNPRIINVASGIHRLIDDINFDDLYFEKRYDGYKAYAQSKLANVLFTYELSKRLRKGGVMVNCLNPGTIKTDIGDKNSSGLYASIWKLIKSFMPSTEKGAITPIYLASSKEVDNISGRYFEDCKPKKTSDISYNEDLAKKLWVISEKLTGLN